MIDNNRFFVTILRKEKKKIWDFSDFRLSKIYFLYVRVCLNFGKIEKTLCIFFFRCIWLQKIERDTDFKIKIDHFQNQAL